MVHDGYWSPAYGLLEYDALLPGSRRTHRREPLRAVREAPQAPSDE